jgi:hypothetical protein
MEGPQATRHARNRFFESWYGRLRSRLGHGLGVAWNVTTPFFLVQEPPGAHNWCIGCIGTAVTRPGIPQGIVDSRNVPVLPSSLYLEQLRERLGHEALANIGYMHGSNPW